MLDDELLAATRGASNRRGLAHLLAVLGLQRPLRAAPCYRLSYRVRALEMCRGSLVATVLELERVADAGMMREALQVLSAARPLQHHLAVLVQPAYDRIVLSIAGADGSSNAMSFMPSRPQLSDIEVLREMVPPASENGTAAALRFERALDRSRVSQRFFRDITACRAQLARAWTGIPQKDNADREALALLLLSRLMFLYFLQRRRLLDGDTTFLTSLLHRSRAHTGRTLYRSVVRTLFFGALNRLPERRTAAARALGELPYLNGGLFEEHALERRRPQLDLPDDALAHVIVNVLDKYRFTTRDDAQPELDAAIEPEMLGRIFEGLMPGDRRSRTGSFYTPAEVVSRVVRATLICHIARRTGIAETDVGAALTGEAISLDCDSAALLHDTAARLRVLDPSSGSGAFLLGALNPLVALRRCTGDATLSVDATRQAVVAASLHGVDILGDATLICSLRLWLALVPHCERIGDVPPLPNLDRQVRQGDALVDPLDVARLGRFELPFTHRMRLKRITASLMPIAQSYVLAGPATRHALRQRLRRHEMQLARCWLDALHVQLRTQQRELAARAADRDLFGAPATHASAAQSRLRATLQQQREIDALLAHAEHSMDLPFFSFRVHFPHAVDGFDVILMNPPWVRSHRWPAATRHILRDQYRVCSSPGWAHAARLTETPSAAGAQVDLSLLFLERAIRLLAADGTIGTLAPAKLFRSLYAGGARALLLEQTELCAIEDHSLDHRSVFSADAFAAVVVAQKSAAPERDRRLSVTLARRGGGRLHFNVRAADLPLLPGDDHAPWLLVPPECALAFRAMQRTGIPVGELGLRVRRGAMTALNDVLVLTAVEPKLGNLIHVRAEGFRKAPAERRRYYRALLEDDVVRTCLRGADVKAWHCELRRHVIWSPRNDGDTAALPRRLKRYLQPHEGALRQRHADGGALQRLSSDSLRDKVVWPDVATAMRACAIPARYSAWGRALPVVPLNTVYFVAVDSYDRALLLAAYLNSLACRSYARAVAERAKDAHFRFFAWTIATLPLPADWQRSAHAAELREISRRAHERGHILPIEQEELDARIASTYSLEDCHLRAMRQLDDWFDGGGGA
ncbi:MAG TPA: hypothetical protein VMN60_06430 [Longimicrobiales bacterium]|nr:hypothetical protein [Longimicrobiales bacterium]